MFYSNNDNYMQDLYFYNQQPNMNTYNPNMNSFQNGNPNMMNNMYMNQNMFNNMNQAQNANNLYPSIYRIISPVVTRVIQNSNYQFLNEDVLNNMVDTVYNIVEGQIDYDEEETPVRASQTDNSNVTSSTNTQNASSTTTTRTAETKTTQTTTTRHNRNDSLLRDIIKILILKELLSRNNQMQFNQNPYYPSQYNNMNF